MHIHSAGRAAVELPYRSGSFPPRAAAFQYRDATNRLSQALASGVAAVMASDSVVISGLGGVGKTQVALDFAQRRWDSGAAELVAWVAAASREAITSSYARLAAELTGIDETQLQSGAPSGCWSG